MSNLPTQAGKNQTSVRYWKKRIAKLEASLARKQELLKRLHYRWNDGAMRCDYCGSYVPCTIHEVKVPECEPDCALAAELKEKL